VFSSNKEIMFGKRGPTGGALLPRGRSDSRGKGLAKLPSLRSRGGALGVARKVQPPVLADDEGGSK